MQFLEINKALQSIQGELLNNISKLIKINKRIKRDTKKLEEVENDLTYSAEQTQLYTDRLANLTTEKQERLEILSQNRKDLQTQGAMIKQTIEKVLDQNTSLAERIRTLLRHNYVFNTDCPFNDCFNNCPCHYRYFWTRRRRGRRFSTKRWGRERSGGCYFKFPWKGRWTVGFVAEHTWALIVFVAGLVVWWLMQEVKKG